MKYNVHSYLRSADGKEIPFGLIRNVNEIDVAYAVTSSLRNNADPVVTLFDTEHPHTGRTVRITITLVEE